MSAVKLRVRRTEVTPTIVAVAIIVLLGIAALLGGDLVLHKQQPALTVASEEDITNSAGRASYPVGDGSTCREVTFDRMNGDILSSFTHPCKDNDPNIVVRRKFIWGK